VLGCEGFDGDPATEVAALYRRTWPRLIGLLVSIGGSRADAEEIAQDAYVKLLGRWTRSAGTTTPTPGCARSQYGAGEPVAAPASRDACPGQADRPRFRSTGPDGDGVTWLRRLRGSLPRSERWRFCTT